MKKYLIGMLLLLSAVVIARQSTIVSTESNVTPLGTSGEITSTIITGKRKLDVNSTDFLLEVRKGNIPNHTVNGFIGHADALTTSFATVWDDFGSGLKVYQSSAVVMTLSSADADDTAAGSGARTVLVSGLDTNWQAISETVILDGQTPVSTVNSYRRILDLTVLTAGATGENEGIIYAGTGAVASGVPATVEICIFFDTTTGHGINAAHAGSFTIPDGQTGYVTQITATVESGKFVELQLWIRDNEGTGLFVNAAQIDVTGDGGSFITPVGILPGLTEHTDIEVRGIVSATTADVNVIVEIILVDD